jgi:type II pantothenate kinase
MGIIIGIDVGISTTKIVGLRDGQPSNPIRITAADPIASLYGAFGKYLHDNNIQLEEVEHVMLTGVGAAYVKNDVYGVDTSRCDEFIADALGARYESHLDPAIVVSMGTGTSFVMCNGDDIRHIGGIGIGGGTLQGLSRLLLNTGDIKQVSALAKEGDVSHINLLIGDISAQPLPGLPMNATASLFARAQSNASQEDIAAGLINTVLQTIGSASVLASQGTQCKDMVMIGQLTLLPQCRDIFPVFEQLYGVRFHIPKFSQFCTAIGAALAYGKDLRMKK